MDRAPVGRRRQRWQWSAAGPDAPVREPARRQQLRPIACRNPSGSKVPLSQTGGRLFRDYHTRRPDSPGEHEKIQSTSCTMGSHALPKPGRKLVQPPQRATMTKTAELALPKDAQPETSVRHRAAGHTGDPDPAHRTGDGPAAGIDTGKRFPPDAKRDQRAARPCAARLRRVDRALRRKQSPHRQ